MKKFNLILLLVLSITLTTKSTYADEPKFQPPAGAAVAINPINVDANEYISRIKLPPGFSISLYADNVPGARSLSLSPKENLFVGTFVDGNRQPINKIYAVTNKNNDYRADEVITLAEGLNVPNGVVYRDGDLYVAEINRITRYDNIESHLTSPPKPVVINDSYPEDFHHGWKFIDFGPDGRLYVPVGAPCNICEPSDEYSVITSIKPDGSDKLTFASGIRNTVGFDWHPETSEMWFTDNGRDVWSDDLPPEELNHAPKAGLDFGYPYRYGKDLVDPEFKTDRKSSEFTPAALELPAHIAPLGVQFYTGDNFPKEYKNRIFIAAHGSWNRSEPDGYRIYAVQLKDNKVIDHKIFASGWLTEEKNFWGRPVDMEIMEDGSMLVSDDHAGVIYRISYDK